MIQIKTAKMYNMDCMEFMADIPDKYYDLAVVDPPYGINIANDSRFGQKISKNAATITKNYIKKDWDTRIPTDKYWDALFRISKNQIVWGVNYFYDKRLSGGRIFWDKQIPENYTKSKGEIAYKSIGIGIDYIKIIWHGMLQEDMKNKQIRIHPTEKPIALYSWIYHNYLPEGGKVIDTHAGSQSNTIAALKAGNIEIDAIELDKEYFDKSVQRVKDFAAQLTIF